MAARSILVMNYFAASSKSAKQAFYVLSGTFIFVGQVLRRHQVRFCHLIDQGLYADVGFQYVAFSRQIENVIGLCLVQIISNGICV